MSDAVVYPPESVYNLLPQEELMNEEETRYMSKYRPKVVLETKSNKQAMRTMGPAKVELPSPDNYLKKRSKEPKLPDRNELSTKVSRTCSDRKPPVPEKTAPPLMGIVTKRNFIKTVTTEPMKPQPASVNSIKGDKQLLENSGLVPKYSKKKHFGKLPKYLQKRIEDEQKALEEYNNFLKEQREQTAMTHVSIEKRKSVLKGLRRTWDQLHREYQALPLILDTMSQKARKEHLESKMMLLENDISLIERFKNIYLPN
ncbi:enkurin isoform X1 [Nelusetta ayraudi]|uniref:enkurin isoform X1 n=1 Tax=Nelusetta ayraudi TaxID=303726 RepID=UPI003F726180